MNFCSEGVAQLFSGHALPDKSAHLGHSMTSVHEKLRVNRGPTACSFPLLLLGCSLVGGSLVGCSPAYAPTVELWPASDASLTGITVPISASSGSGSSASGSAHGSSAASQSGSASGSGRGSSSGTNSLDAGTGASEASGTSGPDAASQLEGAASGGGCSLSVSVTTVTDNGNYSPRNIGAIWIANGSGAFVKTLAAWAAQRIRHLTMWGSVTATAGLSRNTVDAVTGATLSMHETHNVSWNCTDTAGRIVPDGPYRVYLEMTDQNASGPNAFVAFKKAPMSQTLMPPDATYFKHLSLVFSP